MSEVKVNKISPRSGTTVTLGDSGDTIAINSGASLTGFTSTGIDDNATSTAITIDSSENVLVGKTSLDSGVTAGTEIQQNGKTFLTRDGGLPLQITRLTSVGEITTFYKDTTKVAQIGTVSGTDCYIGSSSTADTGLRFQTDEIVPVGNAGGNRGDAIDLGKSNIRWKDFWLSGSIYIGGTTSANALDDYETGTFTVGTYGDATGAFSSETGEYTKIGNVVHVRIVFDVSTNFTSNAIDGLPFTANHDVNASSLFATNGFLTLSNANGVIHGVLPNGGSRLQFSENNSQTDLHSPNTTNDVYRLSFWYYAS